MLKIAHVVATFPPHIGGMGEVCFNEARLLSERGHSVTVFALRYPHQVYHDEQFSFRVIRLRSTFQTGDAGFVPQLFHKLRTFDIVHLHYPFYGGAEWVWLAKLLNKRHYVVTYHMDAQTTGFVKRSIQKIYDFLFARRILGNADKIIAVDKDHFESVGRKFHFPLHKWTTIHNGVDTNLFAPVGVKIDPFLIPTHLQKRKLVLFVGNLIPFKRVDLLLEAFKLVHNSEYGLIIVGGG
jgi:glycosyltransferase involved in cell wall biosynthesis